MQQDLPYNLMTKPIGAICNLDCAYCFYLSKEQMYPGNSSFRMSDEVLQQYVRDYLRQPVPEINFTWQGGEPTLMGLDFYRRAVELQHELNSEGKTINNAIQTNAVNIDDEWARFFKEHDFLVGVSIDGPAELHDAYRYYKSGKGSHQDVLNGIRTLQEHEVEFNLLCCVNDVTAHHPFEIYDFFKEEIGNPYWQFIPIVEHVPGTNRLRDYSVSAEDYGFFLTQLFNRWVRNDLGKISIQTFDVALRRYVGLNAGLCIFEPVCGSALAIEHNGDVFSCDHFVDWDHHLGNVMDKPLQDMVKDPVQQKFGQDKRDTLPQYCINCDYRTLCEGGCPKNRFIKTPDGEPGLNYLCQGYYRIFEHMDPYLRFLAQHYKHGTPLDLVMDHIRQNPGEFVKHFPQRNELCFCGSGRKYKKCCQKKA